MKKHILFALICAALAAPCAAEFKSDGEAQDALKRADARSRLEAIHYLGARGGDAAYELLAGHFRSEKDAYLRAQIVESLNVAGSTWAYACAAEAAADKNPAVRRAAAAALSSRAGEPAAEEVIKKLAADPAEEVRLELVHSLSMKPGAASAAMVGGILADRKGTLKARRAAAEALANMKTPESDKELLKHLSDADPRIKAAAQSRRPSKVKPPAKKKK